MVRADMGIPNILRGKIRNWLKKKRVFVKIIIVIIKSANKEEN